MCYQKVTAQVQLILALSIKFAAIVAISIHLLYSLVSVHLMSNNCVIMIGFRNQPTVSWWR